MHPIYKKRLEKLATFLDAVPEEKFNIGTWCDRNECGTVACVGGWAALMPEFINKGLRLVKDGLHKDSIIFIPVTEFDKKNCAERTLKPNEYVEDEASLERSHRHYRAFDALKGFFGLQDDSLFYHSLYYYKNTDKVKPKHVVKVIRKILKENQ